ncbi:MAG: DUF547 domain-containing protein [Verrucomicrobiota bacterium]|nr:DUF547 domain-containing protein [Verrucomicrobiota bacterium]
MITLRTWLILLAFAACAQTGFAQNNGDWVRSYGSLLQQYVTPSGVKYADWKKNAGDRQRLDQVVQAIASADTKGMSRDEQLAFYINAYNAWILHEALEKYPTSSVKDLFFTFFTSNRIKVAGEQMSFSHLEKDVIRNKFSDPGIHFALNCASRSCPPLSREPFRADNLSARLDQLASNYVNSAAGVRVDEKANTVYLSEIFKWYKDDFHGGVVSFIDKHRSQPLPAKMKIDYQKYDWSLNEAK